MTLTEAIELAKNGKSVEWSTIIISTYRKKLFLTTKYMKDEKAAKAILNHSYVKALSNINLLTNPKDFSRWLGLLIANNARNELVKKNADSFSKKESRENEDLYKSTAVNDYLIDPNDFSKEEIKKYSSELRNSLTDAENMCLLLYYAEGLSVRQIEKAVQCSEEEVTSFLNSGIAALDTKTEEILEESKKSHNAFNAISFFMFLLRAEFDSLETKVSADTINKIIEDTAAVVAAKDCSGNTDGKKETEKNGDDDEEDTEKDDEETDKKTSKKIVILLAVLLVTVMAVTFYFAMKPKEPTAPANNPETVSDTVSSSETSQESTSGESTSESESSTDNSVSDVNNNNPVNNQNNANNQTYTPAQNNQNNSQNNNPQVTEPVVTSPPSTEAPATNPPETEPPATNPPETEPPATDPEPVEPDNPPVEEQEI